MNMSILRTPLLHACLLYCVMLLVYYSVQFLLRDTMLVRLYAVVICLYCPVCNVGALWPNGWMHRDET